MDKDESCSEMSLTTSARKTKVMAVLPTLQAGQQQRQPPRQVQLQRTDEPVDVADEFKYLGSTITSDCGLGEEISARIRKASNSFRSLSKVLVPKEDQDWTKMRMFKATIIPTFINAWQQSMGPSGPAGEAAAKFCDAMPENNLGVISKTAKEKHRNKC